MGKVHRIKPKYSEVPYKRDYRRYKKELREDFYSCCGYCGSPDVVFGGRSGFQIDHFAPKSLFAELKDSYANLVYSCPICNRAKSNKWPSDCADVSVKDSEGFVHPCTPEYDENLKRNNEGAIEAATEVGEYMIQALKLYLFRHQIIWVREELRELIIQVKMHLDDSSALGKKYNELTAAFFEYDELLRVNIDNR